MMYVGVMWGSMKQGAVGMVNYKYLINHAPQKTDCNQQPQ